MKVFDKYKAHYQDNLKLALPVVLSQAGHVMVQISDSFVIGHFAGTIALAGVSLGSSVFAIPLLIGIGVSYGSTPLIAQHNGRKNYAECGQLLSNSLFINLLTGIILFTTLSLGSIYFLNNIHQSPLVVEQAKPFLLLLAASLIPMLIFNTFKQFAEGLGFTKEGVLRAHFFKNGAVEDSRVYGLLKNEFHFKK